VKNTQNPVSAAADNSTRFVEVREQDAYNLVRELDEAHRAAGSPSSTKDLLRFAADAATLVAAHTPEVHGALAAHVQPHGPALVIANGLDVVGPPSQLDAKRALALGLGWPLGDPFQYRQQNGGRLVPALSPQPDALAQTGSSALAFGAHCDDSLLLPQYRTRTIALLGVENECGAPTGFALIDAIVERMPPKSAERAQCADFTFRLPNSFGIEAEQWSPPRPLIYRNLDGELCVQCPTYNTRPLSSAAAKTFADFKRAVDEAMEWFVISPGTYVAFRNDRGLHARQPIRGRRTLLRTYWRPQTAALRAATGEPGPIFDLNRILAA